MRRLHTALLFGLLSTANLAVADSDIAELASMIAGRFDNLADAGQANPEDRMVDSFTRIDAPQLGDYVFYQQINHRANLAVYRQRILVLSIHETSG